MEVDDLFKTLITYEIRNPVYVYFGNNDYADIRRGKLNIKQSHSVMLLSIDVYRKMNIFLNIGTNTNGDRVNKICDKIKQNND
mgnify:CR=1 FL=1